MPSLFPRNAQLNEDSDTWRQHSRDRVAEWICCECFVISRDITNR